MRNGVGISAIVAIVALLITHPSGAGQKPQATPPTNPEDLGALVALLKGGDATDVQKKQAVGKWYRGTVTVRDVVAHERDPRAEILVGVKEESRGNQDNFIDFAFEVADPAAAARVKKGSRLTVTGRLVGTSIRPTEYMHVGDIEVFKFQDVAISEPGPNQ